MIRLSDTDYSTTGLSIRRAFVKASEEYDGRLPTTEAAAIRWGQHDIVVGDITRVPERGRLRIELVSKAPTPRQGADVDVSPGGILLPSGKSLPSLRTWFDDEFEDVVEYGYETPRGVLRTHNVYEMRRGAQVVEERWTGNAAMWVEELGARERVYHCSDGEADPPNFEALVYRVTVS
jgi:hypothetical protein